MESSRDRMLKRDHLSMSKSGFLVAIGSCQSMYHKDDLDLSPYLTQVIKTQNSSNGELSHGVVT
jgi:hypothetical protein